MSKQSNQRYRKEVEKKQTKGSGITSESDSAKKDQSQNKVNREFGTSSGNSVR